MAVDLADYGMRELTPEQQRRHDDIVHLSARLAHAGIRIILPPVAGAVRR